MGVYPPLFCPLNLMMMPRPVQMSCHMFPVRVTPQKKNLLCRKNSFAVMNPTRDMTRVALPFPSFSLLLLRPHR